MLTYVRGKGWVEQTFLKQVIKSHAGKQYLVTVVPDDTEKGNHRRIYRDDGDLVWWEYHEGIPAGFGPSSAIEGYKYRIITEEL